MEGRTMISKELGCKTSLEIATPNESVPEAARRMRERRVGALVVVDERDRPIGMLTDRDLAVRVLGEGRDPITTRVADVMTTPAVVVSEEASIEEALAVMNKRAPRCRRLPVVNGAGRLVGIVTLDDALVMLARQLQSIDCIVGGQTPFITDGFVPGELQQRRGQSA
jgi:CBS domain-containing protein